MTTGKVIKYVNQQVSFFSVEASLLFDEQIDLGSV